MGVQDETLPWPAPFYSGAKAAEQIEELLAGLLSTSSISRFLRKWTELPAEARALQHHLILRYARARNIRALRAFVFGGTVLVVWVMSACSHPLGADGPDRGD